MSHPITGITSSSGHKRAPTGGGLTVPQCVAVQVPEDATPGARLTAKQLTCTAQPGYTLRRSSRAIWVRGLHSRDAVLRGIPMALPTSALPTQAVSATDDLVKPSTDLLIGLNLLGTEDEQKSADGPLAIFTGPPQSVALLESGATALSKWWAAGLGASIAALWGTVATWWGGQPADIKVGVVWGTAIATSALVLAVAYIVGSDVRGRATAAVATINSRAHVAGTYDDNAAKLYSPPPPAAAAVMLPVVTPLPGLPAQWDARPGPDEAGWLAIAMRSRNEDSIEFLLTKAGTHRWAPSEQVSIG